jgi:hypothetical protein
VTIAIAGVLEMLCEGVGHLCHTNMLSCVGLGWCALLLVCHFQGYNRLWRCLLMVTGWGCMNRVSWFWDLLMSSVKYLVCLE